MEINEMEFKPLSETSNLNKRTSPALELKRMLKYKLKFDVVEELIDLYNHPDTKVAEKARILLDLMRFIYPQQKAVEVDTRSGEQIKVNIVFPDQPTKQVEIPTSGVLSTSQIVQAV